MGSLRDPVTRLFHPSRGRQTLAAQWAVLLALSVIFVVALEALHLPAALLLGPMAAGITLSACDITVRVPRPPYYFAQAIVGCLIAHALPASILGEMHRDWPLFAATVLSVIVASTALGWLLTRLRVLPGTTAVWGSSPGAATAMTLMAEAYGADVRLVAFMQYVRVVFVAIVASVVARAFAISSGGTMPEIVWFPPIKPVAFVETLLLVVLGAAAGRVLRIPAGPLLVPLVAGIILQGAGLITIQLPPWLLVISYAFVGWSIGARFTRPILVYAAKVFPRVMLSTLTLIAVCCGFAAALVMVAGVDPLTAYLATSPGGADSVAIIAASSKVDLPFVMAMQAGRLFVVLLTGPSLTRFIARHAGGEAPAEAEA
jgi:uncharacterized protein